MFPLELFPGRLSQKVMTLVLKDIPEPANHTWPAHVPKGWGGDGRGSKAPRGWGNLETDVHDSVLGALMCYPGRLVQPACRSIVCGSD